MRSRYALVRYLAGAASARIGDEMSAPALLVFGLAATGSVGASSALLTGLTASAALGGPVFGALLDRGTRPGRLLAVALACYAAGITAMTAATGVLPLVCVVALAVLTGTLNPALSGGWTAQLPEVATGSGFERANTLDAMTFNVAALAGPALAGVLAAAARPSAGMLTASALIVLAVPAACSLPARTHILDRTGGLGRDVLAGLRAIAASQSLLRATVTSTVSFVGIGMFVVCCPRLGALRLGGADHGALLLTVVAAAALVANGLLARRGAVPGPDRIVLVSTLLLGAGFVLAAVLGSAVWLPAAVALAGFGEGPQLTALFAIRHREAPTRLRAQVFTTGASVKITGLAVGSALAGLLAAESVATCLLAAAGVELLAAVLFLAAGRASKSSATEHGVSEKRAPSER